MTRYLISFPSSAIDHIPDEDFPAVRQAAHAVVQEAIDAGVWVSGGGLAEDVDPAMVSGDGTIATGTYPQTEEFNGGFTALDAPSRRPSGGRLIFMERGIGQHDRRLDLPVRDRPVGLEQSGLSVG